MLRVVRTVLLLILVTGVTLYIVGSLIRRMYLNHAAASWTVVSGEVDAIDNAPPGSHPRQSVLRYSYRFDGKEFRGDTFAFISSGTIDDAFHINEVYAEGQHINVFVNLSNPARSVVAPRKLTFSYVWKDVAIAAMVVALCCNIWCQLVTRRARPTGKSA